MIRKNRRATRGSVVSIRAALGVVAVAWTSSSLAAAPCNCQPAQAPTAICSDCAPLPCPAGPAPGPSMVEPAVPQEQPPVEPGTAPPLSPDSSLDSSDALADQFDPAPSTLPSDFGAVAASEAPSIHMIGDYFASGYFLGDIGTGPGSMFPAASAPVAGGVRRFKATDNLNPFPQDRVFFNYNHFHRAVYDVDGIHRNVDQFTFGLERVFFDGMMSVELRIPFAGGLDAAQVEDSGATTTTEFGNMPLTLKLLLWDGDNIRFTSGLATVLPTAADATVVTDVDDVFILENDAVHIQPYFGFSCANPCRRFFSSGYFAVDWDANGNRISDGFLLTGGTPVLTSRGDIRDQTLVFVDWQIGYWLYQDYGHIGYLNGIAPVLELHYTQATEEPEEVPGVYENPYGKFSLLNLTAGLVFDFRQRAQITVYGAAPLRREKVFFGGRTVSPLFTTEVGVQCNYRY